MSNIESSQSNSQKKVWFKQNNINIDLLDKDARDAAESWKLKTERDLKEGINQVRKYFNEVKTIQRELKELKENNEHAWNMILPRIKMLKARSVYDFHRENSKLPEKFKEFLVTCIDSIASEKDFEVFVMHFEACLGYFYGMREVRK